MGHQANFKITEQVNLHVASILKALEMVQAAKNIEHTSLIHHADRRLEYCSDEYQKALRKS